MTAPFAKVAIIGLGLQGGSIGLALRERLPDTITTGYGLDWQIHSVTIPTYLNVNHTEIVQSGLTGGQNLDLTTDTAGPRWLTSQPASFTEIGKPMCGSVSTTSELTCGSWCCLLFGNVANSFNPQACTFGMQAATADSKDSRCGYRTICWEVSTFPRPMSRRANWTWCSTHILAGLRLAIRWAVS